MFSWERRLFQKTIAMGISSPFSPRSPVQNLSRLKTQLWKTPLVLPVTPSSSALSQKLPALDGELGDLGKNLITNICFLFINHVPDSVLVLQR